MRFLTNIKPISNHRLVCTFDNGVEKIADITQYLGAEAFKPLRDLDEFNKVQNKEYYVEWLDGEVDLSADTLWHIGVVLQNV
ncbi:DUF2442 domain-containing protein [Spirosoma linguale]|uniref:DUF2442 domain-containing protein n=1 Tax=Spirosoma linguale (strain ATCC 33905 / DSM 74 / LMG 10896 / Claus 1) TaxID=504472 RepID=D2QT67_SPILD|nr:Protein of unknown function DUF2442 [Spirosoma linguale DSM 74]